MRVTKFHVTVRYSRPMPDGSHKTLELGAEGVLSASDETWKKSQADLYLELGEQMRQVWTSTVNSKTALQEQARNGSDNPGSTRQHFCEQHQTAFRKCNGPYGEFYSHTIKGTKDFCNESKS